MIVMAVIVISSERILRTDLDPELKTFARQLPASKVGEGEFQLDRRCHRD